MEEKEKKVFLADIDYSTKNVIEIFNKFIENFFSEKEFNGKMSIEITKRRYDEQTCHIELSVGRAAFKKH